MCCLRSSCSLQLVCSATIWRAITSIRHGPETPGSAPMWLQSRPTFPVTSTIFACGMINSCTRATCSSSIDQDRYRLALADAEAALAARHAQHLMALEQYQRRSKLSPGYTITVETLDNARRQSETAAANYQQAIASRDTAALNLNRTEVRAPVNGFITNLNLAQGTYASQGKPVMALIDSDSYRVEAYFEETKIPHIKPGATAEIYLMDGSPALQGTVLGIARGITDQDNKDGPELLSSINPTFTWVRLAQRIPVTIHLTHVPPGVLISAGMTCTVVMKEGAAPQIGLGIRKAMAAIFGTLSS